MAVAAKSNAVYRAYLAAADAASKEIAEPVPLHLRNAPTRLMKELEYGKGYRYAHDEEEGVAANMTCLPPAHEGRQFYEPTDRGLELEIRKKLEELRRRRSAPRAEPGE
jgi:putative ATPase